MNRPSFHWVSRGTLALLCIGLVSALSGCGSSSSAASTEEDKASFRGSTSRMPTDERKKMEAAIRDAQNAGSAPKGPTQEQIEKAKAAKQAAQKG